MKSNSANIIQYNEKKLLPRLYLLVTSNLGE